jgi:hypothetical protein
MVAYLNNHSNLLQRQRHQWLPHQLREERMLHLVGMALKVLRVQLCLNQFLSQPLRPNRNWQEIDSAPQGHRRMGNKACLMIVLRNARLSSFAHKLSC